MATKPLTVREKEIAERIAWGASQKEVAYDLGISRYTVDNTLRKIYAKLRISKINELSAWWFCTNFNISFDLSPLGKQIVASLLICLMMGDMIQTDIITNRRVRRHRTEVRVRRNELSITEII